MEILTQPSACAKMNSMPALLRIACAFMSVVCFVLAVGLVFQVLPVETLRIFLAVFFGVNGAKELVFVILDAMTYRKRRKELPPFVTPA